MEKPRAPLAGFPPSPSPSAGGGGVGAGQRKAPPSPEELVAHYESQGVDRKEAPLKVIEDLQSVIIRVIGSGRGSKDKFMANTTRKLDNINTRLAVLDMKLDSKPGYPQALAIGVSAGATVCLLPHLATALARCGMLSVLLGGGHHHDESQSHFHRHQQLIRIPSIYLHYISR